MTQSASAGEMQVLWGVGSSVLTRKEKTTKLTTLKKLFYGQTLLRHFQKVPLTLGVNF